MNALRAFEAAGRHLNFRAAADELNVTQGAIAQQVRGLEAALGVRLFERGARGVSFTSMGHGYHQEVSEAFARLRAATLLLRPEEARVTISVTPTFASRWLIPNLSQFTALHPEIDFRILSTERVLSFHSDGIDLAVRQGRAPFGAQLDVDLLFRQSIVAVASPELVASTSLPITKSNLDQLSLLHDTHNLWPDFLKKMGVKSNAKIRRNLHFSQTSLSVEAALAGQGVALVSQFLIARDLKSGQLVQVVDGVYTGVEDFYLLARKAESRPPAVDLVRKWLMSLGDACLELSGSARMTAVASKGQ
ncbi:LysR substrate-binding domain-containing protein [Granulosicoccus antarcticus]|nr:LysR substrate-binding domain-containing protein [Granulosicoccus antarcticus]